MSGNWRYAFQPGADEGPLCIRNNDPPIIHALKGWEAAGFWLIPGMAAPDGRK